MTLNIFLLLSAFLIVLATACPYDEYSRNYLKTPDAPIRIPHKEERYKLGDETKPSYYKLKLIFNDTIRLHGNVEIQFEALEPTRTVWMAYEGIVIEQVEVLKVSGPPFNIFDELNTTMFDYQKIGFELRQTLSVGDQYVIKIQYTATLYGDDVMRGVYESFYTENNETKMIYTTHFGQQARRLMPCWDENRFKAQFEITVTRNSEHSLSISNAKIKPKIIPTKTDYFEPTSVISPYLLALVTSEFKENKNGSFSVYARPEAINQTDFALDIGQKLLAALDKWTNMPYYEVPGAKKMAIAAIPDFTAGAMENWGLLTYREVNALFDENVGNSAQKQRIALVIAHELSHMWFGDIVTCHEFRETWLTEGFARYFQFVALEMVDPSYAAMSQFPVSTLQAAMKPDSAISAHPLTDPGKYSYANIRTMFDSITYDKGGSILRMAHNLMGDNSFQKAIRQYLENRKFSTAIPDHLFAELEKEYRGITEILEPYTLQGGFPLVTATKNGDKITLTQKRFLSDELEHNDTTKWNIPITVAIKPENFKDTLSYLSIFKQNADNLTISVANSTMGFYLLNVQQFGYYRVNYDEENWRAIEKALKSDHEVIHPANRAQIIDDLFNLAKVGYLNYDLVFSIISYVKKDKDYLPWLATFNGLSYLEQRVPSDAELKKSFDAFVADILEEIYEEREKLDGLHEILVLNWACKYRNEGCLAMAMNATEKVSPNEKSAVYCTQIRETTNSSEKWEEYMENYVNTNYATEQAIILTALGCTTRRADVNKLMGYILRPHIRAQDKSSAFSSAYSGNPENIDTVLEYILLGPEQWQLKMSIVSTLGDLSARFYKKEQFDELNAYIRKMPGGSLEREELRAISEKNYKLLTWDKERLPELNRFLRGSASLNTLSCFLTIALLMVSYFL